MSDTPDVPRLSSYPILPPATRVRIRNRLTRSLEAVNELLTSARDNAAALDALTAEIDPATADYLELKGAADYLADVAHAARADRGPPAAWWRRCPRCGAGWRRARGVRAAG